MLQGYLDTTTAMPVEAGESPDILFDLGLLFASGRGAPIDLVAAHKWFNLAALKGRVDAIALRREVAEQMTADEIAVAQREARAWITSH
ncbi:sel1 repeat family protein [Rhodopseudomonas sp. B29]|uniref:SEL1-like repeat protein n=1 Tax=Rhodopseudomonas sp. B29 TaxID=95607 RepID=UPI00034980F8|nr:sel1 repeat family protein [Rhodopseudomonas sp. B29]